MAAKKTGTKKVTLRSTGYREKYSVYAELFGQSERAVKRWVKTGKDVGDPCPLDDPAQLLNWWPKHFTRRVPDKILKLGKSAGASGDEQVADTDLFSQTPAEEKEVVAFVVPPDGDLDVGLQASVARLRRAEAIANAKYLHAIEQQADDGEVERLQRAWERISNQLRQQEKSLLELEGKYGAMYSEAELKEVLEKIHVPIYTGMLNLVRRIHAKVDLLESLPDKEALWVAETKKLFRSLNESGFTAPVEPLAVGE